MHDQSHTSAFACLKINRTQIIIIFTVALFARLSACFVLPSGTDSNSLTLPDEQQYWMIAESISSGEGMQDELGFRATRMPLFPVILSLFNMFDHGVMLARIFQALIGAISACMIFITADLLFEKRTAFLSGVLFSVDPFFVYFSTLLLTETFFLFSLSFLFYMYARMIFSSSRNESGKRKNTFILLLGICCAFCIYVRPSSLFLICILFMFYMITEKFSRTAIRNISLMTICIVISLSPWVISNKIATGEFVFLTNRMGISLYDGVGPQADGSSNLGDIKQADKVKNLNEHQWNNYFKQKSLDSISSDPIRIASLAITKWKRTWSPLPNANEYQSLKIRVISFVWTMFIYITSICGFVIFYRSGQNRSKSKMIYLLLPALYIFALHGLFVGSVRYRISAMPALQIASAVAISYVIPKKYRKEEEISI